ncbi:uncharacterized protein LOC130904064 [Diorhabda carinulata]|uniref:uncharacterized protein LOC130452914 n=1 Tax=Diorhabda sublineata TaxID=1163346 RepID=UPI0024E12ACE|nr:uncharacterized protein LOC130452914 [Diorhabda sublineata]XP_057672578.1 uncharacterized protein LOC130904064 [Diorhabda carinulata]
MVKSFMYFMSLKTGAAIMGATNIMFSITATVASSVALYHHQTGEDELYLILALILGIFNIFVAGVIIAALVKGCEKYVFLYIILEMTNLFIITVFAAINVFEYKSFSLAGLLLVCFFLWYGLYCMVGFYNELAEYNSVKSGVIEITCNTNINPVVFPEKAIESTAV